MIVIIYTGLNLNPTNVNIPSDLCGTYVKSAPEGCGDKCGFHGSELTVDFRSNRIYSVGDFNLGAVCIPPSATSEKNPGYDFSNAYGAQGYSSSRSLKSGRIWRSDRPMTAKDFFVRHREFKKFHNTDNTHSRHEAIMPA